MDIQTNLSVIAISISIFTFIFTILIDLKSSIQSLIKQKYLNKTSDTYLNKILLLCYIRLHDDSNEFRRNFDNNMGLIRLKEAFFIEKLSKILIDLKDVQSKKMIFSKKLEKRIELLSIVLNVSHSHLKLVTLDEIIYKGTTAYNNQQALQFLFDEIKLYKTIRHNNHVLSIKI